MFDCGLGVEEGGEGINTIWISVIQCHKEADGLQSARQLLSNEEQLPKDNLSLEGKHALLYCYILLLYCIALKPLWKWLDKWINVVTAAPLKVPENVILFSVLWQQYASPACQWIPQKCKKSILHLLCLLRF